MRPCDAHRSGHGAQHTGGTPSARGSTRGMAEPATTAQAVPTCDAADAPTKRPSPATKIRRHHRPSRNFHRRRLHSDRAGRGRHTDRSRVRRTPHSRPARPDTPRSGSLTRRTVPGSRRSGHASKPTRTSSVTSSTCGAFDAAATHAVWTVVATNPGNVHYRKVRVPGTRTHGKTSAVLELYRSGDSSTSEWSDWLRPMLRSEQRCLFVRTERIRRYEPQLRRRKLTAPGCLILRHSSARAVPVSHYGCMVIGRRQSQDVDS